MTAKRMDAAAILALPAAEVQVGWYDTSPVDADRAWLLCIVYHRPTHSTYELRWNGDEGRWVRALGPFGQNEHEAAARLVERGSWVRIPDPRGPLLLVCESED